MTLKSSLICSTVRERSFPERGRRLDMWHWEMLLTPSCLALQDSFRQLPFPSGGQGRAHTARLPWWGDFWRRWLALPMLTRGHSVEVLQRAWHLLG